MIEITKFDLCHHKPPETIFRLHIWRKERGFRNPYLQGIPVESYGIDRNGLCGMSDWPQPRGFNVTHPEAFIPEENEQDVAKNRLGFCQGAGLVGMRGGDMMLFLIDEIY